MFRLNINIQECHPSCTTCNGANDDNCTGCGELEVTHRIPSGTKCICEDKYGIVNDTTAECQCII